MNMIRLTYTNFIKKTCKPLTGTSQGFLFPKGKISIGGIQL
jgi:hypothetical protein